MSIGSAPEVGVRFARWGDMDEASRIAWHRHMVTAWGSDLQGGYATLVTERRSNVVDGPW